MILHLNDKIEMAADKVIARYTLVLSRLVYLHYREGF